MKLKPILKLESSSAKETRAYGQLFSKALKSADLVLLFGALGGGKTTFTKGVVRGLGFSGRVLSPSFTLIRQYPAKSFKVYHVDLYRLDKRAAFDLGIEDFIYRRGSLTLIEWGDRVDQELDKYLAVDFSYLAETKRKIAISAKGYSKQRLKDITNELIGS